MRVLITGASGFLGGHLAELFTEAGHDVRGLVRTTSDTSLLERLGVETVRGDLKDHRSLARAVEGVDAVIHAASTMGGVPEEYEQATIRGTRQLLNMAQEAGVGRFVHISSVSVYPLSKLPAGEEISEEAPYEDDPRLLTNYSKSKIGADRAALEFAESGEMEVVVLRPAILYGPRGRWNLPRMGYPLGKKWYVIVGNGRMELPACAVENCARAALPAVEKEEVQEGAYNLIDDELFTQKEYLRRLKRDVRPGMKIIGFPYPLARAFGWLFGLGMKILGRSNPFHAAHMISCHRQRRYSNEKAKRELGWRPRKGKEEALSETMRRLGRRERLSRRADIRRLGRPVPDAPPLRACLIGCGMIGREHLRVLRRMKNAKVAALCDVDTESADRLAEQFRVPRTYGDAGEMLAAEKPDVVHVLTPPATHAGLVELSAQHGAHILVEKPMAMDAEEARRMAKCAAEAGVQLCVDHNHLYDPAMVKARKLVESGALGEIIWVDSYYGFNLGSNPGSRYLIPGAAEHWTFGLAGDLYQNLAPHPLSVALELLGKPEKVHAHAQPSRVVQHQATDELRLMLESDNAGGLITVSIAACPRFQHLRIYGTRMSVFVDFLNKWVLTQRVMRGMPKAVSRALMNLGDAWAVLRGTLGGTLKVLLGRWTPYEGLDLLVREYYAALQAGREPPVTADEAIEVMDVMDEAWRQIGCTEGGRQPVKSGPAQTSPVRPTQGGKG